MFLPIIIYGLILSLSFTYTYIPNNEEISSYKSLFSLADTCLQ